MNTELIRSLATRIESDAQAILRELDATTPPDDITHVPAGGDLQAALDKGGSIELEAGAIWEGCYSAHVAGTNLVGNNATLQGTSSGPALEIPPGARDISVSKLLGKTAHPDTVFRIGRNDSQQTHTEDAPLDITFVEVQVPSHRGKRGFYINSGNTLLRDCSVRDTYDPGGQDSQGILIANALSFISVVGGYYEAGSENILVGGDPMKMPVIPSDLLFDNVTLQKPDSWRTDGVKRKVKNLFELKTGLRVKLTNSILSGSWKDAQDGYACVITPHSGGDIHDVTIEKCSMLNIATAFNILGQEYAIGSPVTPSPLSGLVVRTCDMKMTKATNGGHGILAVMTGAPHDVSFISCIAEADGNCITMYDPAKVLSPDGSSQVAAGPMSAMTFTGNHALPSQYGFNFAGNMNGAKWQDWCPGLIVLENSFGDPTNQTFKNNFPSNRYLTRSTWDQEVAELRAPA